MDNNSAGQYRGEYIIVNKEIEVCILIGLLSVHMIPWSEVSTITTEFHSETI